MGVIADLEQRLARAEMRLVRVTMAGEPPDAAKKAVAQARAELDAARDRERERRDNLHRAAYEALGRLAAEQLVTMPALAQDWARRLTQTVPPPVLGMLRAQGWWPADPGAEG